MTLKSQIVTFHLASREPRAWVVIYAQHRQPLVIEMYQGRIGDWSASAWLIPGEYRCRFYHGNERNVTHHGPAAVSGMLAEATPAEATSTAEPTPAAAMDALLTVEVPPDSAAKPVVTILLVEDNLDTLEAYSKLLRMDGHIVYSADGYQAALEIAKRNQIDVAICDIGLWDGDGCNLLKELHRLQIHKAIAVTGSTLPDEVEDYRTAGFAAVLPKPLDHSQIAMAIAELRDGPTISPW